MNSTGAGDSATNTSRERRIEELIGQMSLDEKIGQMIQVHAMGPAAPEQVGDAIRAGRVGSIINQVDAGIANGLQKIAIEESRLGIPLLFGRDVIHGFSTMLPIPLGLAATWNPELLRRGAAIAAEEAAAAGVNWTFAPMIDIARDPRWGRIAESFGEDPYLTSVLGVAMIKGFQGEDLSAPGTIAACAKHFAGYGASESGKDYATTNIPENELRNVHLPPFRAAVDAGVASVMSSFSDLNGIPASANRFLLTEVLREEWGFDGIAVSDWNSIHELATHGLTEGDRESACRAVTAGLDMEMAGITYRDHLAGLIAEGRVDIRTIDTAVANILRVKLRLGLFDSPFVDGNRLPATSDDEKCRVARDAASQSIVLLKNSDGVLPLQRDRLASIAVIGPLAGDPYEQMGTWCFDGDWSLSVTPLQALRDAIGDATDIRYVRALETTRSKATDGFDEATDVARDSDAVLLFLGEEAILSGEAHSRADIGLPGAQVELVRKVRGTGKPVIAVILAGRPLTLADIVLEVDALLYAWHPGSMAGFAIADLLFGAASPSGKLPVTFPRAVGQVPIYYGQKNTGRPPRAETTVLIDDIPVRAAQTSLGNTSYHLDAGFMPLFPFGYGLSYTGFSYANIGVSNTAPTIGETIVISAELTNVGTVAATEVAQLYVRDLVGSVTRPVRELKGFHRVHLEPGETVTVTFELRGDDLAFFGADNTQVVEPGEFHAWIGGDSTAALRCEFRLREAG